MTLKTSSSQKQLCLRKYQQKHFPLGFFSPLILDIASYPPFSSPCLFHQQSWAPKWSWKSFPAHVGLGTVPAALPHHSTRALGWHSCSFPFMPLKNSPFKMSMYQVHPCLTAQNGSSDNSFSAKTLATKSCCISYDENVLENSGILYNIYYNKLR